MCNVTVLCLMEEVEHASVPGGAQACRRTTWWATR